MELNSGDDLISLKESVQRRYSPSRESPPSLDNAHSADEYARWNGLTVDSRTLDWQRLVEHDHALASTLTDLELGQLIECTPMQECMFRAIIPTAEQWQMPVAALQVLQRTCRRSGEGEVADLLSQQCFPETLKVKDLKLEAPLLRSDHGTDCRRLARRVKNFLKGPLPDHRLPLHPVDAEKGEGVEIPASLPEMDRERMRAIENENLAVAKDTLVYLMQSLKTDMADDARRDFTASVSNYQGLEAKEPLTPPLSPLASPAPEYFVPQPEVCELPQLSDPSSMLSDDIQAAESRIFQTEFQFWADVLENDTSPERYNDLDVSEMIRAGELRPPVEPASPQPLPRGLKVDVPLLPCSDDNITAPEPTRVLALDDLAEARELVASSDTLSGSDGPTGQLVSYFLKSETAVMRCAEQEKLQPLDATARVAVPVMDFSIPVPEWDQRLWEAKAMFRWIQKDVDVDWQGSKWTHNRAAEQRMVWTPLAHMKGKELVSEQIEVNAEVVDTFLGRGGDVLTSADYVYKEPGVAVFRLDDDDDDEEELIPLYPEQAPSSQHRDSSGTTPSLTGSAVGSDSSSPFHAATPPPLDLATLLKGRKRVIDEILEKRHPSMMQDWTSSAAEILDQALIPSTNVLRGFESEYADYRPLVENFVDINFPKKPKLTHSSFFAPPKPDPSLSKPTSKAEEDARLMPPPPKPIPALAPSFTPPDPPPRIVISSTTPKPITESLEKLLPGIELIHRTPIPHHPSAMPPGMPTPNLDEADIVLSPATGILLTTMIQLRQKSLPASNSSSNNNQTTPTLPNAPATDFSRRVANVSARHARLIVLVSEGNKHGESASALTPSDAKALAEFQGFVTGLRMRPGAATTAAADVQVVYVGGGAETLARWVAATVCRFAGEAEVVREVLLDVETLWEVFLRRAGMNVAAAQVVLGGLGVPEGVEAVGGESGEVFGLPLFVLMGRERRVELFGEVFGGRGVLDRVSDVIDESWGQRVVDEGSFDMGMVNGWWETYSGNM